VWQISGRLDFDQDLAGLGHRGRARTISSGFLAWKATAARVFILNSILTLKGVAKTLCYHTSRIQDQLLSHAGRFRLGVSLRLVLMLGRTHAPDGVIGAGAQVDIEIVHVAGDVRVIAERRASRSPARGTDQSAAAPPTPRTRKSA